MSRSGDGPDPNRRNMAVTYSSGHPAERHQTLPSFRELLPPHLHDEIDSATYGPQSRQPADRHAVAAPDALLTPRSGSGRGPPLHPPGEDAFYRGSGSLPMPPSGSSTPGGAFPSRGPSPILPPLRDLQSLSSRPRDRPGSVYEDAATGRSVYDGGSAGRDLSVSLGSRSSLEGERYGATPYGSAGAPPLMYPQGGYDNPRYVHYPASYTSESEYSSVMHSPPASTFGVMGDPMDSRGKRRRGNLPKPVTDVLRAWFHDHLDHPYPTEEDKQIFMSRTGLSISQISNWFINARRRQLPALRNQIRSTDNESSARPSSPMSDADQMSSPASTSSPTRSHNHP